MPHADFDMTSLHCARHKKSEYMNRLRVRSQPFAVDILESEIFSNHHAGNTHVHAH